MRRAPQPTALLATPAGNHRIGARRDRGPTEPRAGPARPGRHAGARAQPPGHRDGRRRHDRLRARPPGRGARPGGARLAGQRRIRSVANRPRARGAAPHPAAADAAGRHPRRAAHPRRVRRRAPRPRVPRGRLEARADGRGEPGRGPADQRLRHAPRGRRRPRVRRPRHGAHQHRQGREPQQRDGRQQAPGRDVHPGPRRRRTANRRHALRHRPLRQRPRQHRLRRAPFPPTARPRRPAHRHAPGHAALLHDRPRGRGPGAAGERRGRGGTARGRHLRARHGRPRPHRRSRAPDDPPRRASGGRRLGRLRHSYRLTPASAPARSSTRSCFTARRRPPPRRTPAC